MLGPLWQLFTSLVSPDVELVRGWSASRSARPSPTAGNACLRNAGSYLRLHGGVHRQHRRRAQCFMNNTADPSSPSSRSAPYRPPVAARADPSVLRRSSMQHPATRRCSDPTATARTCRSIFFSRRHLSGSAVPFQFYAYVVAEHPDSGPRQPYADRPRSPGRGPPHRLIGLAPVLVSLETSPGPPLRRRTHPHLRDQRPRPRDASRVLERSGPSPCHPETSAPGLLRTVIAPRRPSDRPGGASHVRVLGLGN